MIAIFLKKSQALFIRPFSVFEKVTEVFILLIIIKADDIDMPNDIKRFNNLLKLFSISVKT